MADIKWIKLDADIFSNRKILQIESLPDGDAIIVIWLKLLTLAGNINDNGMVYFTQEIPYTDQMLASQFRRPLATVQLAMKVFEQFGMIEVIDDILHISNWEKYQNVEQMAVIREQNRIRQKRWYDSHKAIEEKPNVRSNVSITLANATDKIRLEEDKIREDKEIDIELESVSKPKRQRFEPPTLEDVKNFIYENNYQVDAERWFSYYEANGWMVGRNKMKDWKASVRYWNKDAKKKPKGMNDCQTIEELQDYWSKL